MFLLKENLSNLFALDEMYRTPRGIALINSPYYKILFRLERNKILSIAKKIPKAVTMT